MPLPVRLALAGVLGLLVGSFRNVVIHRLPKMMEADWQQQAAELRGETAPERERFNLMVPRSRCPHCGTGIAARHNPPVISWLLLRGRCAHCGASIGFRYPLIEALGDRNFERPHRGSRDRQAGCAAAAVAQAPGA
jgi:leader peptidase (prepilin peptidase)/N-methyltransferase